MKSSTFIELQKVLDKENITISKNLLIKLFKLSDGAIEKLITSKNIKVILQVLDKDIPKDDKKIEMFMEVVADVDIKGEEQVSLALKFLNSHTTNDNVENITSIIAGAEGKYQTSFALDLIKDKENINDLYIKYLKIIANAVTPYAAEKILTIIKRINIYMVSDKQKNMFILISKTKNEKICYLMGGLAEFYSESAYVEQVVNFLANTKSEKIAEFIFEVFESNVDKALLINLFDILEKSINENNLDAIENIILKGQYKNSNDPIKNFKEILCCKYNYELLEEVYMEDSKTAIKGLEELNRMFVDYDLDKPCYVKSKHMMNEKAK